MIRVTNGANDDYFPVAGKSVASVRKALATIFSIHPDALPMVGGRVVGPDHILAPGEELLFVREKGHKGVGSQVWTGEEFCKFFQISREDLDAWIGQGLKVLRLPDGSLRITESDVDEFSHRSRGKPGRRSTNDDIAQAANKLREEGKCWKDIVAACKSLFPGRVTSRDQVRSHWSRRFGGKKT
jgi:hypothetical protein